MPQDIILLNPSFTSQASPSPGSLLVKVMKNAPFFTSDDFFASLFISSLEKHVELAKMKLASDQECSRKSPFITSKFGNVLLENMSGFSLNSLSI